MSSFKPLNYRFILEGNKVEKDELIKIAEGLYQEAIDANAYFAIMMQYRSLYQKYEKEFQLSSTFYHNVYQALQKACFMEVAKLFDSSEGTVSIKYLLQESRENISLFPDLSGTFSVEDDGKTYTFPVYYQHYLKPEEERFFKDEVEFQRKLDRIFDIDTLGTAPVQVNLTFSKFLELYQLRFQALSKKQERVRKQRNKLYVHNDMGRILDEASFLEKNPVYYSDLREMIEFAIDSIGLILDTLTGVPQANQYANIDDLENTLVFAKKGLEYQEHYLQQ